MSKKEKLKDVSKMSYDEAILELEQIMNTLQDENIGLDEMTGLVDRAASLIQYCQLKLKGIKKKVEDIFEEDE